MSVVFGRVTYGGANCGTVRIGPVTLYFSYSTLVAVSNDKLAQGARYRTSHRFSKTTSRHLRVMGVASWPEIPQVNLQEIAGMWLRPDEEVN